MRRRIDDDDPITGIHQEFETIGHDPDEYTIATEQDIEPFLQANLDLRNCFDEHAGWKGDIHHVASIPDVIMERLVRSGITQDEKAFRKWLNDPANRCFRTRPGKV